MWLEECSNGTATKELQLVGKALLPTSLYKFINEGNSSTIKN